MLAILAPVLVFGLVIFVHELGHFLAAKAVGVYAPRFSIGFGPSLFRFRRGETEYILAALPLGGYVRMASRHDGETAFIEGGAEEATAKPETDPDYDPVAMIPFGPKPVPENRWFESKPLAARIFIMIAGVVMNAVLAIVVATVLALHYGQVVYPTTVVGAVHAPEGAAELDQIHPGDTIRTVNGSVVRSWNDVQKDILTSGKTVTFTTQRGTVSVPLGSN
jgi:regulator of sigma E protease